MGGISHSSHLKNGQGMAIHHNPSKSHPSPEVQTTTTKEKQKWVVRSCFERFLAVPSMGDASDGLSW